MNKYDAIIHEIRFFEKNNCFDNPTDDFVKELYKHKCFFLISQLDCSKATVEFIVERKVNEKRILLTLNECKPLISFLNEKNIMYALIKGPMLSKKIYDNPFLRLSSDIDFLIQRENLDLLKQFLNKNGFFQGKIIDGEISKYNREEILFYSLNTHQVAPYRKKVSNLLPVFATLDFNTSIIWGESNQTINTAKVLEHSHTSEFFSTPIRCLDNEMEFISLCLHHYKDLNSIYLLAKKGISLNSFLDIYYYIKNVSLNFEKVLSISSLYNIGRYLYYCFYYINLIFDNELTHKTLSYFDGFKDEKIINSYGLEDKEIKKWDVPFFERLFSEKMKDYFADHLSEYDKIKIMQNDYYM